MTVDITSKGKIVQMPIEKVGKTAGYVEVKILDTKFAYGKVRCLITPVKGSGEFWVDAKGLK